MSKEKVLHDVTFYAYAHVVCSGCGYGQRADVIKHGNSLTLGAPTKCNHCHEWRGNVEPGKY